MGEGGGPLHCEMFMLNIDSVTDLCNKYHYFGTRTMLVDMEIMQFTNTNYLWFHQNEQEGEEE